MIEFMVLSAPRSGSTWMSNWLTTEATLCLHDPVLEHAPEDFDRIESDRTLGLSCSGLALLPDFVNDHPARKLIIHRPMDEINRSLGSIGLTPLGNVWRGALDKIVGLHVQFDHIFNTVLANKMHQHLTGRPVDKVRHAHLCCMHIDPEFSRVEVARDRTRDFRERIVRALQ